MKQCVLFIFLIIYAISSLFAQSSVTINGTITDDRRTAVAGAAVHVLNTSLQTISGRDGSFVFKGLQSGAYILQVTAAGFAAGTINITASDNSPAIIISLVPDIRQLEEVVVTAQKQEEETQKLPVSITALNEKKIADYRLWNSKDITAIVPNLYSADPGDKRNVTALRGIATTSYDQAVTTYIDGVNQFGLDTYISQLFDVERIEVLRGPQGTLYGRNAMGGVINIITKQPANGLSGFAAASIGNRGLQRYSAGIRAPLVKDKLYVGAALLYEGTNGFYTNDFNHRHYDKQYSLTGNYYLKYIAGSRWSFLLNAKHNGNRNRGPFPLVADLNEAFAHPFHLSQNASTKLVDNTVNTSLSVNYTGRHFNFSSQTAYQDNYRYYAQPIDADFSPLDALTIINNYGNNWNRVKVWTEELRFTSAAASRSPFKWVTGAFLFTQNNPVKQATHFGSDAAIVGSPDSNYTLLNTTTAKKYGAALFGQATYAISKKWSLIAGLRYDYEHQRQQILGEYFKDGVTGPLFEFQPDTAATVHFNALSPKLGISYSITPHNLLFATYSRGYRVGGLTPLAADPSQPAQYPFKPEYSSNIETGIKNEWLNHKLLFNATVFYTTVTDAQVPTLVLPDAVTITRNTGRLRSKGIEAEAGVIIAKGLRADYSFGYTDASYKKLKVSSGGNEVNLKGARQIFTPKFTSMLALQYGFTTGYSRKTNFTARGEWRALGRQYFDLANTIAQKSYGLLNLSAEAAFKYWSLKVWDRNLANKKYIAYAYDFGAVHLGDPNTFGATVQVKF